MALPAFTATVSERHAALVAERLAQFRREMDNRAGRLLPDEDPDYALEGEAWPALGKPRRDAVFQPPRPVMKPPSLHRERDMEPQA